MAQQEDRYGLQVVFNFESDGAIGRIDKVERSLKYLEQTVRHVANTVSKAYTELVAGGWLQAQVGLGLFVAPQRDQLSAAERDRRLDAAVDRFVNEVVAIRCNPEDAERRVTEALDGLSSRQTA